MELIWNRLNVDVLLTDLVAWLPRLFAAGLLMAFFWGLFRLTRATFSHVLARAGFEHALIGMLLNVYRFSLMTFGIVMAAGQLGINVGAALAGLGVVGLTVGFAAKDTLSNIMAGFLIFWDKPFHVGDWVSLGGSEGQVAEITMRTTRLRTRNNTWIIIPNEAVINQVLVNHSTNGQTRLEVPVGIAYKEEIGAARRAILGAMESVDGLMRDPAPVVVVNSLGDSSVDLLIQVWIPDAEAEKPVFFRVLEAAKVALDEAGIEIPFPHLQLFVDAVDKRVWQGAAEMARAARNAG
jgi:small conductance mechanosensitive channel